MGLQGINYLAPLLVWPYLMVVLDAGQFGVFSFGVALAQYLMLLVDFGFNLTATKQIALAKGNKEWTDRIFSSTMYAKFLLLAVSAVIMAGLSAVPRFAVYRKVMWIMWGMVTGHTFSMFWLYQGVGKVRLVAIVNACMKLLIMPLTFILVRSGDDVAIAAWIQVAVYIGAGCVTTVLTKTMGLASWVKVSWSDVAVQLRSSSPIFLSNAATSTYTALFVVILGCFVTSDEVGKYAAAEKIMRAACYLIWIPVCQAYFPKVSRLGQTNPSEGENLVRRLTLLLAVCLGVAGVLLFFFAEPIAGLLGKNYAGLGKLSAIMAVVPVLVGVGGAQGQFGLIALGGKKEKRSFRNVYFAAGAVALVSVCWFAYFWGVSGAAYALVLTEGTVCVSMTVLNKRR